MLNLNPIDGRLTERQVKDRERAGKNQRLQGVLRTNGRDAIEAILSRERNVFSIVAETLSVELVKDPSNLYLLQKLHEFAFYANPAQRRQVAKTDTVYLELAKAPGNPHTLMRPCLLREDDWELALWVLRTIVSEEYERSDVKDFFLRVESGSYKSLLEKAFERADFKQDFCDVAISGAKSSPDAHKFLDTILGLLDDYVKRHPSDKSVGYVVRNLGAIKVQLSKEGKSLQELEVKDQEQKQKASESGILAEKKTRQGEITAIQKRIHNAESGERRELYARLIELLALEERFEESEKIFEDAEGHFSGDLRISLSRLRARKLGVKKGKSEPLSSIERLELSELEYKFDGSADNRLNHGIVLYEIGNISEAITILKMDDPPANRTGEANLFLAKSYLALGVEYASAAIECLRSIGENRLKGANDLEIHYALAQAYLRRDLPGDAERGLDCLRNVMAHDIEYRDALKIYRVQNSLSSRPIDFNDEVNSVAFTRVPKLFTESEREIRGKQADELDYVELQKKLVASVGTSEENYCLGIALARIGKRKDALKYLQRATHTLDSKICVNAFFFSALIICDSFCLPDLAKYILKTHVRPFDFISKKHIAYYAGLIEHMLGNFSEAHKEFSLAQSLLKEKDGEFKKDLSEMIRKSYQEIIERK